MVRKDMEKEIEKCECDIIHEDAVIKAKAEMYDDEQLMDVADVFKIFSDFTRVKILNVLFNNELCVCDIAYILGMSKSSISHQLRILKQANLVKNRREGKVVYYSLADSHVETIFNEGISHINE
ncbi:DNA-binding transcriptional regulator, ArsR family [Acetitomaculum ruminis DSM 5522]|uniref:DNA-binding transcriptional regulator, ArsR family n=1 Tax=Acetitomaculum ruminis DSM 5522 TaxID=1120918 RepID=A0A1I0VRN4_9FIRM|nr:metalloregulator ArsR/SmtB family transcription factor [Acetitomaculum ruminis]SFA78356.1 DNA-binding transcriptional regulator, ArsR family [Acetitomaculum ruminis DSM 5522]